MPGADPPACDATARHCCRLFYDAEGEHLRSVGGAGGGPRALVDEVGNLWLMEFQPPETEGPAPWMAFDAAGRMLGSCTFPERFTPSHIGGDFVLGVAEDELDVQRVQLFRLVKA